MRKFNPIEVAKFSTAHGISDKTNFAWWVPYTLRKRDKIISAFNAWLKLTTHKYGVDIPHSVKYSYALDTKNGKIIWQD